MKKKTVSIKDIAKLCGVSVPTVSRVINNRGRYSVETELKVRRVIAEVGYRPSMLAQGLRTDSIQSVGIVIPDITNEFFASIALVIQNKLFENSFTAVICNTNEQPSVQAKQLEMLRSTRVSGIIFISGEDITDEDLNDGIPKVFLDRIPWNAAAKGVVTVEVDNYSGGQMAAAELLGAGCKRLVALFDSRGLNTQAARYAGFIRAHQDMGLDAVRELYCPVTSVSFQAGYTTIKELLSKGIEFDGVFCYSDILASGAIHALLEAGKAVPGDVLVTGYDNVSVSSEQRGTPGITTVEQPVEAIGSLATELILKMSKKEEPEQRQYVLPVRLIRRESTNRALRAK